MAKNLPPIVNILWAANFVVQLALCGILIGFRHFRRLPFFTAYLCLNVCQSLLAYPIYRHYGAYSREASLVGWWSEAITLLARIFATVEILHVVLIAYRGIWGLAWRLLAVTSVVVLIGVSAASWGNAGRALMRADRGYHLIFAVALISCLALIRHYLIRVDMAYKVLLVGFCFYSCVKILLDTVLYEFMSQRNSPSGSLWQILTLVPYLIVLLFWSAALLRPLPKMRVQKAVLPSSFYGRIAPEINLRLQAINQQLMNFWKIEEPQQ